MSVQLSDVSPTQYPLFLKYNRITTNATTAVKAAPGFLHSITTTNAGTGWSFTVFDSLTGSGTTISAVGTPALGQLIYDVGATTGITIVTSGTTPGEIVVSYA